MSSIAKILLVDDNPKYIEKALPMYGYEISTAKDGQEALKLLNEQKELYDLVLLDIMMPNLNGWDTLQAIRSDKRLETMPVIMLTAVSEEQKEVLGLKFGADDYITKPVILPNLLARIEALLRRSAWQKNKLNNINIKNNSELESLTSREKEVLKMVAKGDSNQNIAEKLFVREVTVKTHLNNIFKKLKVTNRTQAVLLAMQMRIIED